MCKSEAKKNAYTNTQIQVHSHLHTRKPTQNKTKKALPFLPKPITPTLELAQVSLIFRLEF